jgi:hypothetical protein
MNSNSFLGKWNDTCGWLLEAATRGSTGGESPAVSRAKRAEVRQNMINSPVTGVRFGLVWLTFATM